MTHIDTKDAGNKSVQHPVRLLLINPCFNESFWSFRWAMDKVLTEKRTLNPPLGLATLAALCPPDWQVEIIDENIEALPPSPDVDIIGICGMAVQFERQKTLIHLYRQRGYFVVAGGSYASLCPELYEPLADTVIAGEAEYIWPRFCLDYSRGEPRRLYQETGVVDIVDSPRPRFDLLKLDLYSSVSMQFSRGCPYRCEFCDIIVMFGRRPRTKLPEQIGRELDLLRERGVRNVFFVDDNLIGNRPKAKALLRYLVDYQSRHGYQFHFGTEASINLAEDDELLDLFRAANFTWVFIGIESPDAESLRETRKTQNASVDLLMAVRKIYSTGIDVLAGFIVGFDNDTLDTFDKQYQFIVQSGIQVAMVGLLLALPKTPLHERLEKEGRLLPHMGNSDNTKPGTNFIPKRMPYAEMVASYKQLYIRLQTDKAIAARIRNKCAYLKNPAYQSEYSLRQSTRILSRFVMHGLFAGSPRRIFLFLGTLLRCRPRVWPQLIVDWIAGLSMQSYINRYFTGGDRREQRLARSTLAYIRRKCSGCISHGKLELALLLNNGSTNLKVTLKGVVDRCFFDRVARRCERLLKKTGTKLTIKIDDFCTDQHMQIKELLQRLARYNERVVIHVSAKMQSLLQIDFSACRLLGDTDPT